ncbi:MAG TPA: tetratricopeptide repeat protein [Aquabacterium sp.]|uniref:O-linked N-acetylglucosamine transferase, SPINDLY family protein n=1 Tax=Aquabacterium sp. TaxID=1872578 RepID=UPI002E38048D|nr:tetratricopeptide repeat protein [Aquabacterium sp.]HEX5356541.1 tetratricopeptide repeat protein [Aquabacterium sp.]
MQTSTQAVFGQQARLLKQAHQHWEHGLAFSKKGEWQGAVKEFDKACKAAPADTLFRLNLARALLRSRQADRAIEHTRRILEQEPANLLARQFMGECLTQLGRHSEAASFMLEMPEGLRPSAEYLQILGNTLFSAQRYKEGINVLFEALSMDVTHAMSHYRLGLCFNAVGMKAEAIECLTTALAMDLSGGDLAARSLMLFIRRELCQWDDAEREMGEVNQLLDELTPASICWSSVFAAVTLNGDVGRQLKAAQACANYYAHGVKPLAPLPLRAMPERLRVGMVSCDFHHHATTILLAEVLEKLDAGRFELHLYSHGPDEDSPMRRRIKAVSTQFVEVGDWSDQQVAEQIRADQIDVLIDLKGHTVNGRLGIFAYRPAPVQVTYLGFPGTSGATYIDYMVGDALVSPLSEAPYYTEKLALMPHCYQPNDRKRPLPQPDSRAAHGLPDDAIVLCGFNQPFKISPEVFDVWCELLHRIPNSVLWLLNWLGTAGDVLRGEAARRGIDPQRLVFAPKVHISEHISRFALADIYLDAWPCNGHTTVSDALWAGVPVVTYAGHSFAQRVAASLLHNVGQPDLISHDTDGYMAKVQELAADKLQREAIRASLHRARDEAPLFDSDAYARDFGDLLWRMAERQAQGLPPDHLS